MMEGITNIAKTILATQDEEVWLELIFYRDVSTKIRNYERRGTLWQRPIALASPGTGFIMGEFSLLKI